MNNFSTSYFATVTNENLQAAFAVGSKDVQALGKISDSPSATQAESNRKAEVNPEPAFPAKRDVKGLVESKVLLTRVNENTFLAGVVRGQSTTCNYSEGPLGAT